VITFVEGLNGAGKTTWIDKQKNDNGKVIKTGYLNPKENVQKVYNLNNRCLELCYETLLRTLIECKELNWFLDRSFISAFVYGTIETYTYEYLIHILASKLTRDEFHVVFIDTDVVTCAKRLDERKDQGIKTFSQTHDELYLMKKRFEIAKFIWENHGFAWTVYKGE